MKFMEWHDLGWLGTLVLLYMALSMPAAELNSKSADVVTEKQADVQETKSAKNGLLAEESINPKPSGTSTSSVSPSKPTDTDQAESLHPEAEEKLLQTLENSRSQTGKSGAAELVPAVPLTTVVCPCQGKNQAACLCLRAGKPCACTSRLGSVWQKTTAKADVFTGQRLEEHVPAKSGTLDTRKPVSPSGGYPVRQQGAWGYWTTPDGINWDNRGTGLQEGQIYGGRFIYRQGRMYELQSQSQTSPQSGGASIREGYRWVYRCINGVCTWRLEKI